MQSSPAGNPAILACLLLSLAVLAGCTSQADRSRCQSADPDAKIAGCTELIQSKLSTRAILSSSYNNRGAAFVEKRDYDRAIQDYNEAIRLNPNAANSFYGRGVAYNRKGDFDRAIQDQNEAIRLNPNFAVAYDARGRANRNKGDFDHAIQDYDQAIRLNPKFATAYNNRGESRLHVGDFDHAIQDFNQAIGLNPNSPTTYVSRGLAYDAQHNADAAIQDFEHAIKAAPSAQSAVYSALALHIAMKRRGQDDHQTLAQVAAVADLSTWPGPALKLDLGQVSAEQVLAAARIGAKSQWQICEANYITGEDALFHHQRTVAIARLRAARDGCPAGEGMLAVAQRELKRLGESPAPAK
jgi:tetratricopeptide (TPR) repeat protein